MNENNPDSIQQAVLDKVRAGTVRRRPRWQFILRVAGTIVVISLLLVIAAFLISFILYSLNESGEQFLLGFGLRGIQVFLTLFPWLFGLVALGLIVLLEWLIRGFRFGYRIPLLNIFLGVVGVSIVLGIVISVTPLHTTLQGFAAKDQLPILGQPYKHVLDHHEDEGLSRGKVITVGANEFIIQHDDHDRDTDDGTFSIHVAPDASIVLPHVGDEVLVFGEPEQGYIDASNVLVLSPLLPVK
ncbi:MAG: hypothetical protein JWM39_292 [Parcubacteria group bacterium]|nr:hypothetical protein [Parcubacteria group bacterium]